MVQRLLIVTAQVGAWPVRHPPAHVRHDGHGCASPLKLSLAPYLTSTRHSDPALALSAVRPEH